MTILRAGAIGAVLCALTVGAASAQEESKPRGAIGLGVAVVQEPYRDLDDETRIIPAPVLQINGGRFSVAGLSASYRVFKNDRWEAAGSVQYQFAGYEADDSPVFVGMEDRNGTLEAGGWVSYNIDETIYLTGYAYHDVLDEHGGYELRAQAAYSWNPHVATNITPVVGLTFRSAKHSDHYYGVRDDEVLTLEECTNFAVGQTIPLNFICVETSTNIVRPEYEPGETVTPYFGISVRQALSRKWAVFFNARHEFLPDEIEDSPIVDGDGRSYAGVAVGRLF